MPSTYFDDDSTAVLKNAGLDIQDAIKHATTEAELHGILTNIQADITASNPATNKKIREAAISSHKIEVLRRLGVYASNLSNRILAIPGNSEYRDLEEEGEIRYRTLQQLSKEAREQAAQEGREIQMPSGASQLVEMGRKRWTLDERAIGDRRVVELETIDSQTSAQASCLNKMIEGLIKSSDETRPLTNESVDDAFKRCTKI